MEGGAMTSEIYENVWDALADTEQEAANLKLRSSLLYEIRKVVQCWNVSQDEAGTRLGLTRPRTNALLRGKLAKFSLDALVNIAASAHLPVELTLKDAALATGNRAGPRPFRDLLAERVEDVRHKHHTQ